MKSKAAVVSSILFLALLTLGPQIAEAAGTRPGDNEGSFYASFAIGAQDIAFLYIGLQRADPDLHIIIVDGDFNNFSTQTIQVTNQGFTTGPITGVSFFFNALGFFPNGRISFDIWGCNNFGLFDNFCSGPFNSPSGDYFFIGNRTL